jgi:peroxiredoxin
MLKRALCLIILSGLTIPSMAAGPTPTDPTQVRPLAAGVRAPAFVVQNADGSEHRFDPARLAKPSILIFYRGGWCPYCNAHMGALKSAEPELLALGYDILFLSADRPEILYSSLKEPDVRYTLLSDARMHAARAFGVAFRVDDATYTQYKSFGVDLEEASGQSHHELPIPAVYIIDRRGRIRFAYTNPDYKIRLQAEPLLVEARRVARRK